MKQFNIVLILTLLLVSCSESILSDIEITDPHLLKVKVKIEQSSENEKEVQVFIRDTKNHPVDMMSGRVLVNGHMVPYDRAEVNAIGTRGYIYHPYYNEQVFEISIYWNATDSYTFLLNPSNGWPGFFCDQNCSCYDHNNFISKNYTLNQAPFHEHEIDISYRILGH